MAMAVAVAEEWLADTLERVAEHRFPHDAERLRAQATKAREYAAKERDRAAHYAMRSGYDDRADEPGREPVMPR